MLAWLSVWSEMQTCIWPSWCHCHSLSLASVKSRLVLPFWYWVVLDKGPLNVCVCVCVCVCVWCACTESLCQCSVQGNVYTLSVRRPANCTVRSRRSWDGVCAAVSVGRQQAQILSARHWTVVCPQSMSRGGCRSYCLSAKMRPVATDVEWSVRMSVCLSVEHNCVLCQTGWTDRGAIWIVHLCGLKQPCTGWWPRSSSGWAFLRVVSPWKCIRPVLAANATAAQGCRLVCRGHLTDDGR